MTFSIIARNPKTNTIVVGIASKLANIGDKCVFVRPKVGCVVAQGLVNKELGSKGLCHLAENLSPNKALKYIKEHDTAPELRQCHIMAFNGEIAHYSGSRCSEWFGNLQKNNISIAGNLLTGETVITNMYDAYLESTDTPMIHRVLLSLIAGEKAGGDKRGKQAAALYEIRTNTLQQVALRVDDHINPLAELEKLYKIELTK